MHPFFFKWERGRGVVFTLYSFFPQKGLNYTDYNMNLYRFGQRGADRPLDHQLSRSYWSKFNFKLVSYVIVHVTSSFFLLFFWGGGRRGVVVSDFFLSLFFFLVDCYFG